MSAEEIKNRTVYMLCRTDKTEDDGVDIYVGSTSIPLKERLRCHQKHARCFKELGCKENNKLFSRMNDVGIKNWKVILLLTFSCDQKTIFGFERAWIKTTGADLNTYLPIREEGTRKEYFANYRENNRTLVR